jgi:hypothetical protein
MLSLKLNLLGAMLLQEAVGFDLITMWTNMGILAKGVVAILAIMSAWSIGVMIDRFLAFGQARNSRASLHPRLPVVCVRAKSKKPSALPNRTSAAILQRLWKPVCRNSERTASHRNLPANRLSRPDALANALKRSSTPN